MAKPTSKNRSKPIPALVSAALDSALPREIFLRAPIGIYTLNAEGKIDQFNPKMMEISGVSDLSKVIGLDALSLPSYKHAGLVEYFEAGLAGKPFATDVTYTSFIGKKTSRRRYQGIPIFSPDKKRVDHLLLLVEDITEEKEAEDRLVESEHLYRKIFELSPEAIVLLDRTGKVLDTNNRVTEWLGYTREEVIGKNIVRLKFMTAESRKRASMNFLRRMIGRPVPPYHLTFISKAGKTQIGMVQGTPLRSKSGKIIEDLVMIVNVTDYEEAKQQLTESRDILKREKNTLETILQSIGDAVLVLDEDREILEVNKMLETLTGHSRDELIGTEYGDLLQFVTLNDSHENGVFIDDVFEHGVIRYMTYDTGLVQKDGTILPVADSAAPIFDAEGKVVACVVVFRDATKEHRLEEMRREFVSVVSHQLRTPLSGVKWIMELILAKKAGPLSDKQEELLAQAQVSNERMIHLVGDLLNVSRLQQGKKVELNAMQTNICESIREAVKDLEHFAAQSSVQILTTGILPTNVQLSCDPEKVREIFHNLLDNAIKYSEGGGTVEVGLAKKDRSTATFFVRDHGIGISAKDQNRIFERYFRGKQARGLFTDGTGLGLYVCRVLVETHGGKIWFEPTEPKGATFFVELPLGL